MQAVEQGFAAGKMRIAGRHAMEALHLNTCAACVGGSASHCPKNTPLAFLWIIDADQVGVLVAREQAVGAKVLHAEWNEAAAAARDIPHRHECRPFIAGEFGLVVIRGKERDEVPALLDGLMHLGDEIRATDEVVILQADAVPRVAEDIGDFLRDQRTRSAPADEIVEHEPALAWPALKAMRLFTQRHRICSNLSCGVIITLYRATCHAEAPLWSCKEWSVIPAEAAGRELRGAPE